AGAYVAACALNPRRDEWAIAQALRRASATATPNGRLVALADRVLGRDGRMVAAIDAIGRGEIAYEADPFRLELESRRPLHRGVRPRPVPPENNRRKTG